MKRIGVAVHSRWGWIAFVALGVVAGPSVFADEAIPTSTSSPSSEEGGPSDTSAATIQNVTSNSSQSQVFWMNYYGILLGPGVKSPSMYQPSIDGTRNTDRPLLTKNFLTAGYNLTDQIAVAVTGFWTWQPVQAHTTELQDPSARIAYNSILHSDEFNWYGDVRAYFPVTSDSRMADMLAGFQTFHYLSYQPGTGRLALGLYLSARYNMFGKQGAGNDLELWFAPEALYRLGPSSPVSLSLMYESNVDHVFGYDPFNFFNSGNFIEPGVVWEISPAISVNPYLVMPAGTEIGLNNTWLGMTVSWLMM